MLVLGAIHGLSFSLPASMAALAGFVQIALFGLAWYALARRRPGQTATLALTFGIGNFVVGLSWLYISMNSFGGMPGILAASAVVLLSAYLALFGAAALALANGWLQRADPTNSYGPGRTACLVAACWGAGEIARGFALTGFPWLSVGYAHLDAPWHGLTAWVGAYGLGAFAILLAVWLAELLRRRAGRAITGQGRTTSSILLTIVIVVASASGLPGWASADGEPVAVRLTQGNVPQSMKFDTDRAARATLEYLEMVASSKAALTVLPETAFVRPMASQPPALQAAIDAALRANGGLVAIGLPALSTDEHARRNRRIRLTNSMMTYAADGQPVNRYDKRHLVPFGEYIPFGFAWFVNLMEIPLGEFGRGGATQPLLALDGRHFAFNICYEDLFGEELAVQVRQGANVLINVSNLAWFGNSHALPQHLAISRMRALEMARPMLRSTNTGVTASIDHEGRVLAILPYNEQAVLDVLVQPVSGLTPFTRAGMLAPLLLVALLLAASLLPRRALQRR